MARRFHVALFAATLCACGQDPTAGPEELEGPRPAVDSAPDPDLPVQATADADQVSADAEPEPNQVEAEPEPEPEHVYVSSRAVVVRAEPDSEAELVGTISRKAPFGVYAFVDGPRCRRGPNRQWAKLARGGYACLAHGEPTQAPMHAVPKLEGDQILPYVYARPRRVDGSTPETLPVWRNKQALLRGDEPVDNLPGYSTFAFKSRRFSKQFKSLYYEENRRVMVGSALRLLRPSQFAGRDLAEDPVAKGEAMGWVISREARLLDAASASAPASGPVLPYHHNIEVLGLEGQFVSIRIRTEDGVREGFLSDKDVARWIPPASKPAEVGAAETWVSVELREQTLTVSRGETPIFATLISSGRAGDATPTGSFRIELKKALGTMRSLPDAEEPYAVEAVPWAAYFQGRYAIHGAYWHDRFGRRNSHGCVNLAPADAKLVFEALSPSVPGGWVSVRTQEGDAPTLIDIRKEP